MTKYPRTFRSAVFVVILMGVSLVALLISPGRLTGSRSFAQSTNAAPHCQPVGGTVMTNLGVIAQSTTLGVADGDLNGAVAATILNIAPGSGGSFHVASFSTDHTRILED